MDKWFESASCRDAFRQLAVIVAIGLATPLAHGANIITFGDNANSCGGAVMCSTNGTLGYRGNQAFNLSTIGSWFQISVDGVNELPLTQTSAEPNKGSGAFLVVNDTGATITSFSLTITDDFTAATPSVTYCSGNSGPLCDNFQAQQGALLKTTSVSVSGADFVKGTNCNTTTSTSCTSTASQAAANFTAGLVTYTWTGFNLAAGQKFDLSFASWQNNDDVACAVANGQTCGGTVPEPSGLSLLAAGLLSVSALALRRRKALAAQ